jgi:hypothetical protein
MKRFVLALIAAASLTAPARAESVYAVREIPGYKCMKLNLTEKQALDFSGASLVWILTAPETHAPRGTWAASVVFVRTPEHLVNGYLEVLQATGKPGWIEADQVKPYDPNMRCVPSVMSNGRIGPG